MLDIPRLHTGYQITILRQGHIVASLEYDWVKNYAEVLRADQGEIPLPGNVLYVSEVNVTGTDPTLIWRLRHRLPKAKWIVGLTEEYELKCPKGLPHDFYAE